MMTDDRSDGIQRAESGAQRIAHDRMLAHDTRFLRVQLAFLQQHGVRHGDLADVVEETTALERRQIRIVQSKRTAKRRGIRGKPLAMAARTRIARLDSRAKTEENRLGRLEIVGVPFQSDERANAGVQLRRVEWLA